MLALFAAAFFLAQPENATSTTRTLYERSGREASILRALEDRSPRVQLPAIALAVELKSAATVPLLARIAARESNDELTRLAAVEAISALAELVAAPTASELVWKSARDALLKLGPEGREILSDALARAPAARRATSLVGG